MKVTRHISPIAQALREAGFPVYKHLSGNHLFYSVPRKQKPEILAYLHQNPPQGPEIQKFDRQVKILRKTI